VRCDAALELYRRLHKHLDISQTEKDLEHK
jgi:hypothetical protein